MAYDVAKKMRVKGDCSCGLGGEDDIGSLLLNDKDQDRLYNKIDDVRYDVRRAGSLVAAGVGALAGAVAMLGISQFWRAGRGRG
jgi:hypothetical protein